MQVPPEIVLRDVETTPYIDELISRGIDRLEKVCDYIIGARIAIERAQGRHRTGNPYRMRIDIKIPDRANIVVSRTSKATKKIQEELAGTKSPVPEAETEEGEKPSPARSSTRHHGVREEPLTALVRRTFDSARRELEKVVEKQRGEVKTHAQQELQAVVERLLPEQGYGFLRNMAGEQVYFHRNSVLHRHWDRLSPGTIVRYTPELGEKGLQASSVALWDKPGVAELHNDLHDLPAV